jgi:hypothetical protein
LAHHRPVSELPEQRGLVQDHRKLQRRLTGEQLLPLEPGLDPALHLSWRHPSHYLVASIDLPGVSLGL